MLLCACIDLLHARDRISQYESYRRILEEASTILRKSPNSDSIHGALLAVQGLLNHSQMVCSRSATSVRVVAKASMISPVHERSLQGHLRTRPELHGQQRSLDSPIRHHSHPGHGHVRSSNVYRSVLASSNVVSATSIIQAVRS